jgi:hypothetical protein
MIESTGMGQDKKAEDEDARKKNSGKDSENGSRR